MLLRFLLPGTIREAGERRRLRIAIETGADGDGHGVALAAEPGRNDGAEAAGRAAGGDDQQAVLAGQRGIFLVAARADDGALPAVLPFPPPDAGLLEHVAPSVRLRPAGGGEMRAERRG